MIYTEISSNNLLIESVKDLYIESFPSDERRDFDEFLEILDNKSNDFHIMGGIIDGKLAGFITFWNFGKFIYAEHFAVQPELRGRKLGENFLEQLKKVATAPVILEVEPPTYDMAIRRINFYLRNGLTLYPDFHYVQPPYDATKNAMELKLMSYPEVNEELLETATKTIHKIVYRVD